jgi:hypothetical protein
MKNKLWLISVLFILFAAKCFANPIENEIYRYTVQDLWGLDAKACFPDSNIATFKQIAKISKATFGSIAEQINNRYPSADTLKYEWQNDDSFVLDRDTSLIGLKFNKPHMSGMRFVFVDSLNRIVYCAKKEYKDSFSQISFQGKVYINPDHFSYWDSLTPKNWNLLLSGNDELFDTLPYEIAYYQLVQALIDNKKIKPPIEVLPSNCFFTIKKSYYYFSDKHRLCIYDLASKKLITYQVPLDNQIIKTIMTQSQPHTYFKKFNVYSNEYIDYLNFSGVVGNYIVFSNWDGWTTILVDMRTNKVYTFTSENISNKLNIKDISDPSATSDFSEVWSGYQIFVTENNVYYFMETTPGGYYVVKMILSRS